MSHFHLDVLIMLIAWDVGKSLSKPLEGYIIRKVYDYRFKKFLQKNIKEMQKHLRQNNLN